LKPFYMDTNVFIARYKPDDPFHESCKRIVQGLNSGELEACTSVLTIVETACVASRNYEKSKKILTEREIKTVSREKLISSLLKRLVKLNLRFINIPGETVLKIANKNIDIPILFKDALLMAYEIGLKSFDIIHLATLKYCIDVLSIPVEAFVTGDTDFLNNRKNLENLFGTIFITPDEYVRIKSL